MLLAPAVGVEKPARTLASSRPEAAPELAIGACKNTGTNSFTGNDFTAIEAGAATISAAHR